MFYVSVRLNKNKKLTCSRRVKTFDGRLMKIAIVDWPAAFQGNWQQIDKVNQHKRCCMFFFSLQYISFISSKQIAKDYSKRFFLLKQFLRTMDILRGFTNRKCANVERGFPQNSGGSKKYGSNCQHFSPFNLHLKKTVLGWIKEWKLYKPGNLPTRSRDTGHKQPGLRRRELICFTFGGNKRRALSGFRLNERGATLCWGIGRSSREQQNGGTVNS